ncbi:MAG: FKBP-type peptidyl-prolyl cis-trans isomerase [Flavipsychrobacter sp.]
MNKSLKALCLLSLAVTTTGYAQKKKPTEKAAATKENKTEKNDNEGFSKAPSGMLYKIVSHGTGTKKPVPSDFISIHMMYKLGDSVLFSTRQMMNGQPAEIQMQPITPGDIAEGYTYMVAGDSAIFKVYIDSLAKLPGFQVQPWMKTGVGQTIDYYTTLVAVKTQAEKQAEMKMQSEQQKTVDDEKLQAYFKEKNLKPSKTASGMYYTIEKQGTGAQANMGDTAVVNYTGKTLEGKPFDSNTDPQFGHVQPFSFPVGMGMVIKGWDEAFQLFKVGTKGTIYIPSGLAYGPNSPDPNRIPVNGILIFDVELKDVKALNSAPRQMNKTEAKKKG